VDLDVGQNIQDGKKNPSWRTKMLDEAHG